MKKADIIAITILNEKLTTVTEERDKFMRAYIASIRDLDKAHRKIKELEKQACELNKVNI